MHIHSSRAGTKRYERLSSTIITSMQKPTVVNPLPSFQPSEMTEVVEMMPQKAGNYSYSLVGSDLQLEQEAFKPGPNVSCKRTVFFN